jgi:hypothetical protein
MSAKGKQIKGVMLTGTSFAVTDLTARFECSEPNVYAHLAALRKAGHEFEKVRGDNGRTHYRHTGQPAAVAPTSTEDVVVSNGTPKKRGLQDAMLGTEPFTLADMAARHQSHVVWVTKVRRQLQTQGHHYTRSIANHVVTFCHVPDQCAPGLHSLEITTTTAPPKPVKREGGGTVSGAARLPFSPSLDAQMVTTMLRRQPDGSLLMAFSDGDNEYVVQHVGTLPLGEMSL